MKYFGILLMTSNYINQGWNKFYYILLYNKKVEINFIILNIILLNFIILIKVEINFKLKMCLLSSYISLCY